MPLAFLPRTKKDKALDLVAGGSGGGGAAGSAPAGMQEFLMGVIVFLLKITWNFHEILKKKN